MKILFKKIFSLTLVSILIFLTGCGKNPIKLINKEKPVSNLNFSEFDFGVSTNALKDIDFSGSDLSYTVFTNMTLENINFSGAIIDNINFSNSTIISSTFESNSFGTVNWTDASLDSIDFSGNDLSGVSFIGLKSLKNSKFIGIGVNGTDTLESPSLKNVTFENINLISGIDFSLSNLENATFSNIDTFEDINFKSKAVEIDIKKDWPEKGDIISGKIVPIRTSLKNVKFSDIKEFKNVDFSASDLTGSTFENIESINSSTFASIQKKATDSSNSAFGLQEGKTTVIRTLLDNSSFINTPINSCNFRAASLIGTKFDNVDIHNSGFPAATYEYLTTEKTYYFNPIFKNTILHNFSMKNSFIEPNENKGLYDFDVNQAEIHLSESGKDGAYGLQVKGNDLKIIGKNLEKRTESKTLLKTLKGSINNITFDNLQFGVEEISKTEKVNKYSSRTVTTRTELNALEQEFKFGGNVIFDDVSFNAGDTNNDKQNGLIFIKPSKGSSVKFLNSLWGRELRFSNDLNELKVIGSQGSISLSEMVVNNITVSNSSGNINLAVYNSDPEKIEILNSTVELISMRNEIGDLIVSGNNNFQLSSLDDSFGSEEISFFDNSSLDLKIGTGGDIDFSLSSNEDIKSYLEEFDIEENTYRNSRRFYFYSYDTGEFEEARKLIIKNQIKNNPANSDEAFTPNLQFLNGGELKLLADPGKIVVSNYNDVSVFCGSNLSEVEMFEIKDATITSSISEKSIENIKLENVGFTPGPDNLLFDKWDDQDYWKLSLEEVKSQINELETLLDEISDIADDIDDNFADHALELSNDFEIDGLTSLEDMIDNSWGNNNKFRATYAKVINDLKVQKVLTAEEISFIDSYAGNSDTRRKTTDKHKSLKELAASKTEWSHKLKQSLLPSPYNNKDFRELNVSYLKDLELFQVESNDRAKMLLLKFLGAYNEVKEDYLNKKLIVQEKLDIAKKVFKEECDTIISLTKKINAPAVEQNNRINAAIEPFAKEYAKFIYESNAETFAMVLMFSNEERATRGIITGDNSYLSAGLKRVLDAIEARIFNRIKSFMTKEMDNYEINIIVLEALTEWLEKDPKLTNDEIFRNLIRARGLDPEANYGRTVADELSTIVYDVVQQSMRDLQR